MNVIAGPYPNQPFHSRNINITGKRLKSRFRKVPRSKYANPQQVPTQIFPSASSSKKNLYHYKEENADSPSPPDKR